MAAWPIRHHGVKVLGRDIIVVVLRQLHRAPLLEEVGPNIDVSCVSQRRGDAW
jgi:hypothetical protein